MEALIPKPMRDSMKELLVLMRQTKNSELEARVLNGSIHSKDEADRIIRAIERISSGGFTEENRATFNYPEGIRVTVKSPETILKVCSTNSFRGVPLTVEKKTRYNDSGRPSSVPDTLDVPDLKLRFTLKVEEPLRRDFTGSPVDPSSHVRIMNRRSWKTADGLLRIDMSMVKTKTTGTKTIVEILKLSPRYELEVEVIDKDADPDVVMNSLLHCVEALVAAYQQTQFVIPESDIERYKMEFESSKIRFINPVTLERSHMQKSRPHSILSGYTVTNKADGERSLLMVMRDRRLIKITPTGKITWTGITCNTDAHYGDVLDGEYIAEQNLFCIFDVYTFRTKKVDRLPLMTTDTDVRKNPLKSRLGCALLFVEDLKKDFSVNIARSPLRIETKLFLAGDGESMQTAIRKILDTTFEYETDGLIFTPRQSMVAPIADRRGDTWIRVYKWKPASHNSIDFLVRFTTEPQFDPVEDKPAFKGQLYVSRTPGSDFVYPCETITGEYVPKELPPEMRRLSETRDRAPTPFQPSAPKSPEATDIFIYLDGKGQPIDSKGNRVENDTIIECARNTEKNRWILLRTRYDKTYQYRVLKKPQFGNDIHVADNIWTNMHNPITEEMIRVVHSSPPDDTFEDDLYYRDALQSRDRILKDVYSFHNKIKETLYSTSINVGDTLLELAVGRAGDLHKWRKTRPSKVVGIDISQSNIESPRQGACVRYLTERTKTKLPPVLFAVADMTMPLLDQENRYLHMLDKREPAPTPYLQQFEGLTEFDVISCQMAIHYACASEETFRKFVGNLTRHGKGIFFGTCLDGRSVYSLMMEKQSHVFRSSEKQIYGEFTKEYDDGAGWSEDFGRAIVVKLESFELPMKEYLVPFEKVTEILKENGYELVETHMFEEYYTQQKDYTFEKEQSEFSFLHRSFKFKRVIVEKKEEEEEPEKKEEEKKEEEEEKPKEEEKKEPAKKKKLSKKPEEPGPEPVLFFAGNAALTEFKEFSNHHEAPMQIDGITFPTVEHYFQWSKAKQFGDADAATKIMKTPSPKTVKALGKKVKDFKEDEWNEKKDQIMRTALKAKFVQHPALLEKLKATGSRPIGEANPRDKYWAIGTSSDTSKAKDPAKWPGKNTLGTMLQELRTEMSQ